MDSQGEELSRKAPPDLPGANLSDTIDYHLGELALARDASHPRHLLPDFRPCHKVIIDIGCGIGQTFIAAGLDSDSGRTLVGIDYELEPLQYGRHHSPGIQFLQGDGNSLPIGSGCVDLVVSRVSLPYTNIPLAMAEIHRILKPGGEIWITLHPARVLINPLIKSFRELSIKGFLVRSFFLLNGLLLHWFGFLLPHPRTGVYESFQTNKGIRRLLERYEFDSVKITRGVHFLVTASKSLP